MSTKRYFKVKSTTASGTQLTEVNLSTILPLKRIISCFGLEFLLIQGLSQLTPKYSILIGGNWSRGEQGGELTVVSWKSELGFILRFFLRFFYAENDVN